MTTFNVVWSVTEIINGPGRHDGGVRDGDRTQVASGETTKIAESANVIRAELMAALRSAYPEHGVGPTYDIDRVYNIEIEKV